MAEFRRSVKCSKCGNENSVFISSGMELSELLVAGKCPHCGSTLQLNYNLLEKAEDQSAPAQEEKKPDVQLDESMFEPQIPSEAIKELIEE